MSQGPTTHLHAAIGCHQLVLEQRVPQAQLCQVCQQVLVDHSELATQHTPAGQDDTQPLSAHGVQPKEVHSDHRTP